MPKSEDFGEGRVSRLRELLEAEEGEKSRAPEPAGGKRPPTLVIGGVAAGALVVVLLFLVLPGMFKGGGSGDEVPAGASETSVSVFPSRIPASVGKNQKVNICGRAGELIAGNVRVVERHTADQLVAGQLVVLDVIATPEEVGRLSSEKATDLRVVRGSCAATPEASSTTVTTPPPAP